jgi:hypothetical protein
MKTKRTKRTNFGAKLLEEFELMVPEDYDHNTQLTSFSKKNRKDFYRYDDRITDAKYVEEPCKLTPGRTYTVRIFQMTHGGISEEFVAFMELQKAFYVGAQGLSVAWQLKKDKFPIGLHIMSWSALGEVSSVSRVSDSGWSFDSMWILQEGSWNNSCCLLCFCEKNTD